MLFDKSLKLFPITDFAIVLRVLPRLGLNIPRFGFALAPQVNCVATDIEQLTCLTFLETVQLESLALLFSENPHCRVEPFQWGRRNRNPYSLRPNEDGFSYISPSRII